MSLFRSDKNNETNGMVVVGATRLTAGTPQNLTLNPSPLNASGLLALRRACIAADFSELSFPYFSCFISSLDFLFPSGVVSICFAELELGTAEVGPAASASLAATFCVVVFCTRRKLLRDDRILQQTNIKLNEGSYK